MKKILAALVLVILIVSSLSLLSMPRVKADSSEAQILSYSWYVAPATTTLAQYVGDLIVVGEVQNVGTNTITNVVVDADASNATGDYVGSAEFTVYANSLSPGQKAPFYLDFTPDETTTDLSNFDQNWASYVTNVTARVVNVIDSNQTQYSGLAVQSGSVSVLNNTDPYTVTGTVQNTGNQATGPVWVVTTFYNASGTVVAFNYTDFISESLLPGNSAMFTATPVDDTAQLSSSITNYSFSIQAEQLPTATPTPPISTATIQPSNSPTGSGQPSSSPSLGIFSSLLTDAAIMAAVIVIIILVAFMLLRRRRNADFDLPPPPPPT